MRLCSALRRILHRLEQNGKLARFVIDEVRLLTVTSGAEDLFHSPIQLIAAAHSKRVGSSFTLGEGHAVSGSGIGCLAVFGV